jgi:putative colanic acid biosynthesis UDP-glucose lipid carrier transferase
MDMHSPAEKAGVFAPLPSSPVKASAAAHIRPQQLGYLSLVIDILLYVGSGIAAWVWLEPEPSDILQLIVVTTLALTFVIFTACCRAFKTHDPLALLHAGALQRMAKVVASAGLPALIPLLVSLPMMESDERAVRDFVAWLTSFELLAILVIAGAHGFFHFARPRLVRTLFTPQRVAVVGSGESAVRLIRWVERTAPGLFEIIGVFDDRDNRRTLSSSVAHKIRGNTGDLIELYKSAAFDKIVIALPHSAEERLLFLLRTLRRLPVDIVLAPDLMGFNSAEQETAEVAGLNLLSLANRPIREPQRLLKAGFDFVMAAAALLLLSPLLLGIALLIRLDSDGPILFRQRRHGLGDRLFDVYKFRTMYCDMGDPNGAAQTKRSDPRVTRLGAFLRKTSLDELPQLLNVLKGEMSLVGPRPHSPHMLIGDKRHFEIVSEYSFRHRVKPGITGLAQVNGYRGAVDTEDQLKARVDLDLYYIDHWSLWLDIKILWRTAFVCLSGRNAY